MSKIITDKEMGEIILAATHDPNVIEDNGQYVSFLHGLATLITDTFGGDHVGVAQPDKVMKNYTVAFNVNECVPPDGGVFKDYDTDVTWEDNKER